MTNLDPAREYAIVQRALEQLGGRATPSLSADLDALFTQHQAIVASVCRRIVGDPERASELAQEAQLVAYSKLGEFREGHLFSTWVYGIARNLCLNAVRRKADLLAEDGVVEATDESASLLSELLREERETLIRDAAAAALDPLEQEAVHLRYVEGLPQERITEILGLEGTGARGLLQRCRRKLGREVQARLRAVGHGRSFLYSKT